MENTHTAPMTYEQLPQEYHDVVCKMGAWTEDYSTTQLLDMMQQLDRVTEHVRMTYNDETWGHWAMDRIKHLNMYAMNECVRDLARLVMLRTTLNYEPVTQKA